MQGTCKRRGLHTWVGKIPWRRAWQSTPVSLPGESHGQRSLAGYNPQSCTESDTAEATEHACMYYQKGIHFSSKLKSRLESSPVSTPRQHPRYSAALLYLPIVMVWIGGRSIKGSEAPKWTSCVFGSLLPREDIWPSILISLLVPKTEALSDGFTRPTVLEHWGSESTCSFHDKEPVLGIWKVFAFSEGSLESIPLHPRSQRETCILYITMTASLKHSDFGIKICGIHGCLDWKISVEPVCVWVFPKSLPWYWGESPKKKRFHVLLWKSKLIISSCKWFQKCVLKVLKYLLLLFLTFFLATLSSMWDLDFPTRNLTCSSHIGGSES